MSKNRRSRQSSKWVTDNHSYKILLGEELVKCPICWFNNGCNKNTYYYNDQNSWKTQRLTQWRNKS